jgi:hypothetical protein
MLARAVDVDVVDFVDEVDVVDLVHTPGPARMGTPLALGPER